MKNNNLPRVAEPLEVLGNTVPLEKSGVLPTIVLHAFISFPV